MANGTFFMPPFQFRHVLKGALLKHYSWLDFLNL
jgi:hypothetical protein